MNEIIFQCKSINNKNVRNGELKILRKCDNDNLCFEFGESEMNLKKRFYDNENDFENDFEALTKLKESKQRELVYDNEDVQKVIEEKSEKNKKSLYNKNTIF